MSPQAHGNVEFPQWMETPTENGDRVPPHGFFSSATEPRSPASRSPPRRRYRSPSPPHRQNSDDRTLPAGTGTVTGSPPAPHHLPRPLLRLPVGLPNNPEGSPAADTGEGADDPQLSAPPPTRTRHLPPPRAPPPARSRSRSRSPPHTLPAAGRRPPPPPLTYGTPLTTALRAGRAGAGREGKGMAGHGRRPRPCGPVPRSAPTGPALRRRQTPEVMPWRSDPLARRGPAHCSPQPIDGLRY